MAAAGPGPAVIGAPAAPGPSAAEMRAWARADGIPVPGRGRLRPGVWRAWRDARG